MQIIKNGGLQYGEQATQAIKKSGDKAVEALTKVPTKDCAELIAKHGNEAADVFVKYGDEAVSAVKNCSSSKQAIKSINAVGEDAVKALNRVPTEECASAIYRFNGAAKVISDYGDDALDVITKADALKNVDSTIEAITKRGENAVVALKNATPTKECTDLLIKYGDDASIVISNYGDDAVNAISKCDAGQRNAITVINSHGKEGIRIVDKGGENLVIALSNADNITQKQFVQFAQSQNDEFIQSIGKWTATDDPIEMSLKYKDKSVPIIEKYCDDQVIGLSKAMNSESTAITFVRDPYGIVHVAGSGNYSYNPSITVPENYLNPNVIDIDSDYFYQKYNDLLTEDGIKMMNVSEETAVELRKLNEAVENTKKLAKAEAEKNPNGNYRYISRGGNEEYSFVVSHGVSNCGEIWSTREAILNGAKFDELDFATYCNNRTSSCNVGDYKPKCKNCQHTFGGV